MAGSLRQRWRAERHSTLTYSRAVSKEAVSKEAG
ncbi:unannotated protein [freshwater metagenome]|uniref:Unannotated protein n=1 Tax=freshwater metagenome TaxID=449393 RepID=A0A6J6SMP5_9ZZZZ